MSAETADEQPRTADEQELDYETARDQLADVVAKLEAGGLSLEDSLALWERGEALAALCERHLAGAQERVEAALAVVVDETSGTGETDGTAEAAGD